MFKQNLRKLGVRLWTRFNWLKIGCSGGFCWHSNTFSGSRKVGEITFQLSDCQLPKSYLCYNFYLCKWSLKPFLISTKHIYTGISTFPTMHPQNYQCVCSNSGRREGENGEGWTVEKQKEGTWMQDMVVIPTNHSLGNWYEDRQLSSSLSGALSSFHHNQMLRSSTDVMFSRVSFASLIADVAQID